MKINKEIIFFQKKKIKQNIIKHTTKIKENIKIHNKTAIGMDIVIKTN